MVAQWHQRDTLPGRYCFKTLGRGDRVAQKQTPEQKAVKALADGVTNTEWNGPTFARHILGLPIASQWRILESFFHVVKSWRRFSAIDDSAQQLANATDLDHDMAETEQYVDLSKWDG